MKKPPDLDGFFCGNYRTVFFRTVPITIGNADLTDSHIIIKNANLNDWRFFVNIFAYIVLIIVIIIIIISVFQITHIF